jgi:hypothetical protein
MKGILTLLFVLLMLLPSAGGTLAQQGSFSNLSSTPDQTIFSYSLNSTYVVNQFGWTSSVVSLDIHNTGAVASQPVPVSVAFPRFYYMTLWDYNVSGLSATPVLSLNTTFYNSTLPSIPAGGNLNVTIGMEFYGLVRSTGGGNYLFPITPVPIVTLPESRVTNATLYFTLPNTVQVVNALNLLQTNFTQIAGKPYSYRYSYTNLTNVYPFPVNVQFNSTNTATFAIFRISNLDRIIKYGLDGSIQVTDELTIMNNDSIELTSIQLTEPVTGTYQIAEGQIHASTYKLSSGVLNLPAPIPYQGVSVLDISYPLNRSSITQGSGGLEINLSRQGLIYPSLVGNYEVTTDLPSGSSVRFLGPSSFANVTSTPSVVLIANVPSEFLLRATFPVAVAGLVVILAVYAVYARGEKSGAEGEVDSVMERKKRIILGLLEDIRLRGEGFTPYAYFTDERKEFEAERNRLNAQINDLRAKAKKDKAYRSPVDRLASFDSKFEQAYKEAKQVLEDKLSGKVNEKQFVEKLDSLRKSLE